MDEHTHVRNQKTVSKASSKLKKFVKDNDIPLDAISHAHHDPNSESANTPNDKIVSYKVLGTQMEMLTSKAPETLYCGGVGSGKSLALCIKLIEEASKPGNVCILARKTLTALKASTLRMLLEPEGDRDPLLPRGSYIHNKVERRIQLNSGGIILYTGLEDAEQVRSINAGSIFVDECSQLKEGDWMELLLRLRVNTGCLQIYGATNPSFKHHWLYKRFFLGKSPRRIAITANSMDNPYLPKATRESLADLEGSAKEKFVEGLWTDKEKSIYGSAYDPEKNSYTDLPFIESYIVALDYGFTHPTGILLIGLDAQNHCYVMEEWRESKKLNRDILAKLEEYRDLQPIVIIDPSAAAFVRECEVAGFNAIKANNDVNLGIDRVKSRLQENSLHIHEDCEKLSEEIENYTFDDSWKPIKINDDLVDPLRYAMNYCMDLESDLLKEREKEREFYIF
jgi:PBSX family phage terminase large subunit